MGELIDAGFEKPYSERVRILNDRGIAVWDVLKSCVRSGSLDLDIRDEEPNDFQTFFKMHSQIKKIGLNGTKAVDCFEKVARKMLHADVVFIKLPSTSRANTWMTFDEKRDAWRNLILP